METHTETNPPPPTNGALTVNGHAAPNGGGVIATMAARHGMDPRAFEATLRGTVVPSGCTKEQFAAFLLVAKQYDLNPITKEIYAFPAKGGGIQPIVSIDGWMNIINSHPQMDGLEFEDQFDANGKLKGVTARIWRKDRSKPTAVTEYMAECARDTEPWKKWPARMLRHKAAIQGARYAFGFSGVVDPDEAERFTIAPEGPTKLRPPSPPKAPPPAPLPPEKDLRVRVVEPKPKVKAPPLPAASPSKKDGLEELLDANAAHAPADPIANPAAVLQHFDEEMEACGDEQTLDEVWSGFEAIADRFGREDRRKAEAIYERHLTRVNETDEPPLPLQ